MRRFGLILAAIFISPEMLIGLTIYAGYIYFPDTYSSFGNLLKNDSEIWKYLPALTLALSAFAFKQSFKLRAPLSGGNKLLYGWPYYIYFVDRVCVCLAIASLSAVTAILLWILGAQIAAKEVALIFLLGSTTSGITALTMLLAHQKIIEILESH